MPSREQGGIGVAPAQGTLARFARMAGLIAKRRRMAVSPRLRFDACARSQTGSPDKASEATMTVHPRSESVVLGAPTFMHLEKLIRNNKTLMHFGTTKDSWTNNPGAGTFVLLRKIVGSTVRDRADGYSALCHDVAVGDFSRGSSHESLDGNLSPYFPTIRGALRLSARLIAADRPIISFRERA